jgi:hypothetical protein
MAEALKRPRTALSNLSIQGTLRPTHGADVSQARGSRVFPATREKARMRCSSFALAFVLHPGEKMLFHI